METRTIMVGNVPVGGGHPISIQSMTNTKTKDIKASLKQILELEAEGCNIVRMAVNDLEDAQALPEIKKQTKLPIIADIQFDHKLALYAVENGADGLRLNPGNIGSRENVEKVVRLCQEKGISIRVGVNSGSIKQEFLDQYSGVNEKSMVYSALEQVEILEDLGFKDIKISLKASSVDLTLRANRLMSRLRNYPLHLGITESGPVFQGSIKSSVGLGILLGENIGDTIRVSLTGDPVEEVRVAKEILRSLGLYKKGIEIISCPTCARTNIDLISIVNEADRRFKSIDKNIKVAIMGCVVNGPGEAREADLGIAGGQGEGIIFAKGQVIKKVREEELLDALVEEIEKL